MEIFAVSHFCPEQHDLIVCRLIYNNISLKNNNQNKNKKNLNNNEDNEDDEIEDSDENENDNNANKEEIEDNIEKKEIILNEKGMFIFAMKKNIFIVEGNKISEKNFRLYKNAAIDYIKQIKHFEKLGLDINEDNIEIIKQNEIEIKYAELMNDRNIIIKFSDTNNMDKFYVD